MSLRSDFMNRIPVVYETAHDLFRFRIRRQRDEFGVTVLHDQFLRAQERDGGAEIVHAQPRLLLRLVDARERSLEDFAPLVHDGDLGAKLFHLAQQMR